MRIIRSQDCRIMPWKNGGGSTTEIAISPDGASLDDFDWRISMAQVGSDGPFSRFAGVDRTLSVLTGAGMALGFADGEIVQLTPLSAPYRFDGERPVEGRLIGGPVTDLNVMTRRGRWRHAVRRCAETSELAAAGDLLVFVATAGRWLVETEHSRAHLHAGEGLVLGREETAQLTAIGNAAGSAIELRAGASS